MELGTWNTWDYFCPQEKWPLRCNNSLEVQHGHWLTSVSLWFIQYSGQRMWTPYSVLLNCIGGSAIIGTYAMLGMPQLNRSARHNGNILSTAIANKSLALFVAWPFFCTPSHAIFLTCGEFVVLKAVERSEIFVGWFPHCSYKKYGPLSLLMKPNSLNQCLDPIGLNYRKVL